MATDNPKDTATRAVLVDPTRPLDHLPPALRAILKRQARQATTAVASRRSTLPKGWKDLVQVIIGQNGGGLEDVAQALGINRMTLTRMRKENPEIDEHIAAANGRFRQMLVSVVVDAAVKGDRNCAMWLLARKHPDEFGDKATPAATQQTLVLPQGMTPGEMRELFQFTAPLPPPTA